MRHERSTSLRQPGLGGFYFDYEGGKDNELKRIGARLFSDGKLRLEYRDRRGDSPGYHWRANATNLPFGTTFGHHSWSCPKRKKEDGTIKACTLPAHRIPGARVDDHVIGLTGFDCKFDDKEDHKLAEIGVSVSPDGQAWSILPSFGDATGRPWTCRLDYAIIAKHRVSATEEDSGTSTARDFIPVSEFPDVLGAFSLEFERGDHKLDRIGVATWEGQLRIVMRDKNHDDQFRWQLTYHQLKSW
jgi:hypothetical protein